MIITRWRLAVLAILSLSPAAGAEPPTVPRREGDADKLWVFVGTYSHGKSKGIYRLELDLATENLPMSCWPPSRRIPPSWPSIPVIASSTRSMRPTTLDPTKAGRSARSHWMRRPAS